MRAAMRQTKTRKIVILSDNPESNLRFKNLENVFIVPLKPYLLWELREAGFLNVRDLREWQVDIIADYDDYYLGHEASIRAMVEERSDLSWDHLKQGILDLMMPVQYIKNILKEIIEKENPSGFELRILDPGTELIFKEALRDFA